MGKNLRMQFLFPGHGSERVNMTRALYEQVDAYREEVEKCLRLVDGVLGFDLRSVLFPDPADEKEAAQRLSQTIAAQPALFSIEYSLAKVLGRVGVKPDGMLGHSVSEYVAACLAGVFSLESAIEVVVKRGQLVQQCPPGAMLAVALPEDEVSQYLSERISLGSTIGQQQSVLSGFPESIERLRVELTARGIACKQVRVTRAFHSMMLDPVLEEFGEFVASKTLHPPQMPFISGIDGKWVDPVQVQNPDYWVRQLRYPVRFFEGISTMAETSGSVFLEVGKGAMLTSLARNHPMVGERCECLFTSPTGDQADNDLAFLLGSLEKLETLGFVLDKSLLLNNSKKPSKPTQKAHRNPRSNEKSIPISNRWQQVDKLVTDSFCYVLGDAEISRDQNFLEAGGNSLMAMQVISRIQKHLGLSLPIKEFFKNPTIDGVVSALLQIPATSDDPISPVPTDKREFCRPEESETIVDRSESGEKTHLPEEQGRKRNPRSPMDFSLFFFSGDEDAYPEDRYKLVMEGARFADENGFDAIWIPERHFNKFGGLYPNPSVLAAAIASTTKRIHVRGGSVVAPLHHPVRIAEEWSVVDNLSKGRIGIAFGSGFHPNDFLFAPDAFRTRKETMLESVDAIERLWTGGSYSGPAGTGEEISVSLLPRPYSKELPIWLATTRSPETFEDCGKRGFNVLTALLRLSIPELRERIVVYRQALGDAGRDPGLGKVTVMLHTFVGHDMDFVRSKVEAPMKDYLKSHMEHTKEVSREKTRGGDVDLSPEQEEALLDHAFERYFETSSLMGTEEVCLETIQKLKEAGVDEVACLIDFGIDHESLMTSLKYLNRLRMRANGIAIPEVLAPESDGVAHELDTGEGCPLSSGQQRIWFLDQFEPNTSAYNLNLALRLQGEIEVGTLERALREVVARHGALRTRIQVDDGQPQQLVVPSQGFEFPFRELDGSASRDDESQIGRMIQEEAHRPFDLSRGPLFRASLLRRSDQDHILLLATHHIISDGWSLAILKGEIIELYKAFSEGAPSPLPTLRISFFDFCRWQLEQEGTFLEHLGYWRSHLAGAPPHFEIPTDLPRPSRQTSNGAEVRLTLSPVLAAELHQLGLENSASTFIVLLAALQTLLHRYSGSEDIVVGVPIGGRVLPEHEDLVGLLTGTLPMRAEFRGDPTFEEFLAKVNEDALDAYAHQVVPFERLIDEFEPERDLSRSPIFQVLFAFQNFPGDGVQLPGIQIDRVEVESKTSVFDLAFYVYEVSEGLSVKIRYNSDLFLKPTMERLLENFQVLLHGVTRGPERRISELPVLSEWEQRQLLVEWNQTARIFDDERHTHELIEATVGRVGDRVAAIFPAAGSLPESLLTYRELGVRSNRLARYLAQLGVGPEVVVGICLDRREEMLVSVLGTLKAGGAYLPLDSTLPEERQHFMLQDSGAKLLITEKELKRRFEQGQYRIIDPESIGPLLSEQDPSPPEVSIGGDTLAYVIYTSGSSGRPKGVEICHGALANFLRSMLDAPGMRADDRLLAITTLSFDIAALELFLPLIAGACIVVADSQATVDGQRIRQLISNYEISVMQGTPSTWRLLLESGWRGDEKITLLCGGEALEASLAGRLSKQCRRLWNLYGPTETTIWSSRHEITGGGPVLIGRPIANTTLYVLDENLKPLPIGVPGDLFIGGKGLARGYRNRPELTAECFLKNPFEPGKMFYRTGDRARWLDGGTVECFGRTDHQVKLRGYRIELGEIESALTTHPDVIEAAVVVRGEQIEHRRLVAYVSARNSNVSADGLQDYIGNSLPEYMVPSLFVWMDRLPKTANGKIDRNALPESTEMMERHREKSTPPESSVERSVAAIWSEVLGLRYVGLKDSFFRAGGHSLTSIQLISKINQRFSLDLPVVLLFENPTLEKFCRVVESSMANGGYINQKDTPGLDRHETGTDANSHDRNLIRTWRDEKFFRGAKNRVLQLFARFMPNAFRTRLHRLRGVDVGRGVAIGYDSIIETSCPWLVAIGDRTRIGMRVTIIGHFAEMEGASNNGSNPTVRIEADVWIGPSVTILPNVTIGRGSVVAAGSTVTMTVPPGMFVQGNPARPVAVCGVPLTRDVTYEQFIKCLEPIEGDGPSSNYAEPNRPQTK